MSKRRALFARARKSAGLTQEELAYRLGVERSTVGRWKAGLTEPSPWVWPRLAKFLGISRSELGELLTDEAPVPVPISAPLPPTASASAEPDHLAHALQDASRYLDETVIGYFGRQLDVCVADDGARGPTRTLPAVLGVLSVVEQHARQVKPDVRRQLLSVGARGAEFAGWLYRDAYCPELALYWRDRAVEWAQEAGDWSMQGYILLKKSQSAWDERDGLRMLTLAQAAQDGPWTLSPLVRAEAAQQEARGLAMTGEPRDLVERKLDEAWKLIGTSEDAHREPGQLGRHYSQNLLMLQSAICHCEAGEPLRAAELYTTLLADDRFSYRDRGYFMSLMAAALALAGEPDRATDGGQEALQIAQQTNSKRTMQELARVCDLLAPWQARPIVRELRAAVSVSSVR